MKGYCGNCHKIWTLETGQGLCQWCGKLSTCQSSTAKPRPIKSRSNRHKRQALIENNGYDHLEGEWLTYYQVASRYAHKAQAQDREDLLQTIISNLADAGRNNGHKPDNQSWMYRIASFTLAQYWRNYYRHTNGIDCGHCSNRQRKKCKDNDLYRECPKAIRIESLSKPILDDNGHLTELGELISDDKALDLAEWLDIQTFISRCPQRLILIAEKIRDSEALTEYERLYLYRFRKRQQKALFSMITN
jgi:DNA-directed RNA polymerase specialized sigma24 family protein